MNPQQMESRIIDLEGAVLAAMALGLDDPEGARDILTDAYNRHAPGSEGVALVAAERERQISVENWTAEHDDRHTDGSLSAAAICYAADEPYFVRRSVEGGTGISFVDPWPWWQGWDKRGKHPRLRRLAIAGALIAAEIDRRLRLGEKP